MSLGLQWLDQGLEGEKPTMSSRPAAASLRGRFSDQRLRRADVATRRQLARRGHRHRQGARDQRRDKPTICWTGDGGTYDIGMATLSAAAERNENLIYICYDNEIYGTPAASAPAPRHWA